MEVGVTLWPDERNIMTTLTLDPKYADVLRAFGNLEEAVEEAIHRYTLERVNERIEKARHEILTLETKYGMSYQQFNESVTTDEAFVERLEATYLTWELDWQTWEYYEEVLAEWIGHLEKLSKP
jgi:hypothetical protein